MQRTALYWCKTSKCLAEIAWRHDEGADIPICFGITGIGNVCQEPHNCFIKLPHIAYWLYGLWCKAKNSAKPIDAHII